MGIDNRQIVYIHGLSSSVNSQKFKILQQAFPSAKCVEWTTEDNIFDIIQDAYDKLKGIVNNLVIIGSSTGGNFAWQLQKKLKENGKSSELILLNPLIDSSFKYDDNLPEELNKYLVDMNRFENTKVFLALHDDVLNTGKLKDFFEIQQRIFTDQIQIIEVDDNHRIENFETLLTLI